MNDGRKIVEISNANRLFGADTQGKYTFVRGYHLSEINLNVSVRQFLFLREDYDRIV